MTTVYHAALQQPTQLPLFVLSKLCSKCGIEKSLENFEFRKDQNKHRTYCKVCANAQALVRKKRYRQKQASLRTLPAPLPPGTKHCPRCKQTLPFDEFGRNRSTKDGLQSYCKDCRKDQYQESASEISQRQRQYREVNKGKLQEQKRQYYQENQDRIRSQVNLYRKENPEKVSEWKKQHYQNNRDAYIERSVQYQIENRDAHNAQVRKYSKTLKGKLVSKASGQRRRAKQKSVTFDKFDYATILERDGYHCYICNYPIDPTKEFPHLESLVFDHVVPLQPRAGEPQGAHTEENIRPAHHLCNTRKANIPLELLTPWQRRGVQHH